MWMEKWCIIISTLKWIHMFHILCSHLSLRTVSCYEDGNERGQSSLPLQFSFILSLLVSTFNLTQTCDLVLIQCSAWHCWVVARWHALGKLGRGSTVFKEWIKRRTLPYSLFQVLSLICSLVILQCCIGSNVIAVIEIIKIIIAY